MAPWFLMSFNGVRLESVRGCCSKFICLVLWIDHTMLFAKNSKHSLSLYVAKPPVVNFFNPVMAKFLWLNSLDLLLTEFWTFVKASIVVMNSTFENSSIKASHSSCDRAGRVLLLLVASVSAWIDSIQFNSVLYSHYTRYLQKCT